MYQATIADDTQRVADSKMVEEEDNSNQKPEKMIKEVRKNVNVTLANEDGNNSVQGHWQGRGQGQQDGDRMAGGLTADQFHDRLDQLRLRLVREMHRWDTVATSEGEDTPKLDQVNRGNTEATSEGEDTPKLDQVNN